MANRVFLNGVTADTLSESFLIPLQVHFSLIVTISLRVQLFCHQCNHRPLLKASLLPLSVNNYTFHATSKAFIGLLA